ncbi:hypothetical protein K438DRAFT_1786041 [Mycena galopus ATCC 62051]|nr:hypothetical protein K438DRAFT_1786041 [Mycena galopus ATCC 62051]
MSSAGWLRHRPAVSPWNHPRRSFLIFLHSYLTIFAKHRISNPNSNWSASFWNRNSPFVNGSGNNQHGPSANWNGQYDHGYGHPMPRNSQHVHGNGHYVHEHGNDHSMNMKSYRRNPAFGSDNGHFRACVDRGIQHRSHHNHYQHHHHQHHHHRHHHPQHHQHHHFDHWAWDNGLWRPNEWRKTMSRAQLRAYYGQGKVAVCVAHVDPSVQLSFVQNDVLFDADGWIAQTLESLPYVGFSIAIIRRQSGDEDRFRRAMIHASGSTAVALLGSVGGHYGGPFGAAFVAAAATPLKMLFEQWAGSTLIADPALRQEFEEVPLGQYLIESISSMIAAGSSNRVSQFFKQQAAQIIEVLAYPVLQELGKWAVKKVGNAVNSTFVHKGAYEGARIVERLVKGAVPDELLNSMIRSSQLQRSSSDWHITDN